MFIDYFYKHHSKIMKKSWKLKKYIFYSPIFLNVAHRNRLDEQII